MNSQLSKEQKQKISELVSKARVMKTCDLETFRDNVSVSDGDPLVKDNVIEKIDILLNNKSYVSCESVEYSNIKDGDRDEF